MLETEHLLSCNGLQLNKSLKTVEYKGSAKHLSPNSFELLAFLMQNSPSVVSVDELLTEVWNNKVVNRETVKQQIKTLRDQLGVAGGMIESVRGFGYQIKPLSQDNTNLETTSPVKWPILGVAFVGLLAVIAILWSSNQPKTKLQLPLKTAVLPFKLLDSSDQDLVLLLQDELTNMLSRQADVRAISISAIEHAEYENYNAEEFASQLDVDMLFEGSIKAGSDGYQVSVRMVWTQNSVAVWRENIRIEDKDRQRLVNQTRDILRNFIQKKVSYIKNKNT